MTDIEELAVEHACTRLMIDYCRHVDDRAFDRLCALFSRDGVLKRPREGEIKGRDAIGAFFGQLPPGPFIHACSNPVVDVTGQASAEGCCYVTICHLPERHADGVPKLAPAYLVVKYLDRFVLEDGAWKISFRDTLFVARA